VSLRIDRSTDGGAHFRRDQLVAQYRDYFFAHCGSGTVIPAQGRTCVRPNPVVIIDNSNGRFASPVYVTYAAAEGTNNTQAVYLTAFTRTRRPLFGYPIEKVPYRVNPPDGRRRSDQFWPASAVDAASGRVWVCYYDTRPDPLRRKTHYMCTTSIDG